MDTAGRPDAAWQIEIYQQKWFALFVCGSVTKNDFWWAQTESLMCSMYFWWFPQFKHRCVALEQSGKTFQQLVLFFNLSCLKKKNCWSNNLSFPSPCNFWCLEGRADITGDFQHWNLRYDPNELKETKEDRRVSDSHLFCKRISCFSLSLSLYLCFSFLFLCVRVWPQGLYLY